MLCLFFCSKEYYSSSQIPQWLWLCYYECWDICNKVKTQFYYNYPSFVHADRYLVAFSLSHQTGEGPFQLNAEVFVIKEAWSDLLIYFKQTDLQIIAKRFQFLLVNDESHPELSSIKQQMNTTMYQPCQLLPTNQVSPIISWLPAEGCGYLTRIKF